MNISLLSRLSVATDRDSPIVPFLGALAVILGDSVLRWAISFAGFGPVNILPLTIIVLSTYTARYMWAGIALGAGLLESVFVGPLSGVTIALSASAATLLCDRLWSPPSRTPAWFLQYLRISFLTVGTLVATHATLSVLVGHTSFSVAVMTLGYATLPITVAGSPLVWLLVGRRSSGDRRAEAARTQYWAAAVLGLWIALGYILSNLFRSFVLIPPGYLSRRLSPAIRTAYSGTGNGRLILVSLGVVAVLTLSYVVTER